VLHALTRARQDHLPGRRLAALSAVLGMTVLGGLAIAPQALAAPKRVPGSPVVKGAHASMPALVRSLPSGIEDPTPYLPQDDCDPTAKPGAVALQNLLLKTYPDSVSLGIVSTCAAERMVSEHSDGRALDWGVKLANAHQNAEAQAFLAWLFAPDTAGNDQAMARRLGVMYVIWDGRIRSTGGDWQPYQQNYCWKKGKVGGQRTGDVTQCHRNHIHISLAWNGAMKRTSFWSGHVAAVDYGPCIPKGKKVAPKYSGFNGKPCANDRYGVTTTPTPKPKPTPSPAPTFTWPTDPAPTFTWPTDPAPTDTWPTDTWPTDTWPTDDDSPSPSPSRGWGWGPGSP
jgi:hypothetical protein